LPIKCELDPPLADQVIVLQAIELKLIFNKMGRNVTYIVKVPSHLHDTVNTFKGVPDLLLASVFCLFVDNSG
jgi:hypothetical protein